MIYLPIPVYTGNFDGDVMVFLFLNWMFNGLQCIAYMQEYFIFCMTQIEDHEWVLSSCCAYICVRSGLPVTDYLSNKTYTCMLRDSCFPFFLACLVFLSSFSFSFSHLFFIFSFFSSWPATCDFRSLAVWKRRYPRYPVCRPLLSSSPR